MVRDADIRGVEARQWELCVPNDKQCALCERNLPNREIKYYVKIRWDNLWACEECVLDRELLW